MTSLESISRLLAACAMLSQKRVADWTAPPIVLYSTAVLKSAEVPPTIKTARGRLYVR